MDDQHFFADVDLPFHVWVKEGRRWVLRDAASRWPRDSGSRSTGEAECGGGEPPPRG